MRDFFGNVVACGLPAALLMLTFTLPRVFGQQATDYSKVQIKTTKVSGNIYMLEGAGGNIAASVGEDGIVIVDDQYAPLAEKIQAALKESGHHRQAGAICDQHALSRRPYRRKRAIREQRLNCDRPGQCAEALEGGGAGGYSESAKMEMKAAGKRQRCR